MPKERTHWMLARESRKLLPNADLKALLEKEQAAFLLGSIAPDTIYMPGILKGNYKEWIPYFHGKGNPESFSFWRIAPSEWLENPQMLAFLYGISSHLISDSYFHPSVFYFTGWKDHEDASIRRHSTSRHHRLEGLLDLYLQDYYHLDSQEITVKKLIKQVDIHRLSEITSRIFFPNHPLPLENMVEMFQKHGKIQALYDNGFIRTLAWFLKMMGIELKGMRDLVYYRPLRKGWKDKPFIYRHPVTGEAFKTAWKDMAHACIRETLGWFNLIDNCIQKGDWSELPAGPLADMGLPSDCSIDRVRQYCNITPPWKLFL